jgi:carboxyl-terminal processing protease
MMRPFWIAIASFLFLIPVPLRGQDQHHDQDAARYSAAFEAVWSAIDQNFYDPSFLGINWADVGTRYRTQLPNIDDDGAFKELVDQMLRELPTSHLHFRVSLVSGRTTPATKIGILTHQIDGEDIIIDVDPNSDAGLHSIRPGDVLLTKEDLLRGPWGSPAEVEVKHCNQEIEKLSVDREPYGWPYERPSVQWRIVERSAKTKFGYLRITHLEDDVAPLIDEAMKELAGTTGIIVDLRNNTGGNASYVRLMSYFAPKQRLAFILLSRPFLNRFGRAPEKLDGVTLSQIPKVTGAYTTAAIIDAFRKNGGGAAFYTEEVGKNLYTGKVILLVNQETASAAESFVWNIKGWPSVTVIGQATAGAIVGAEDFSIPGGWTLTLPTHAAWGSDGSLYRDQKSVPDLLVPESRKSLCRGEDAVLDAAIGVVLK